MSIRYDERAMDTCRRLCFLLTLFERVADGEDVSAAHLDMLVNLDPILIEFLADFVASRNAKAAADDPVDELVEGMSTTSNQPTPNVVPLFPSHH